MFEKFGIVASEMAHIGNNIFDDIQGGNEAGVITCFVRRNGKFVKVVKIVAESVTKYEAKEHCVFDELEKRKILYKHHVITKDDQYFQYGMKPSCFGRD